jgi:hypothetical protein
MRVTNKYNLPEPLYHALVDKGEFKMELGRVRATTLIMPVRQSLLMLRHDAEIEEDASDAFWRLLGKAMHSVLQTSQSWNTLKEIPLSFKLGNWTVTGHADLWESTKVLSDYKITSAWSYVFRRPDDYEDQLNLYRLGLSEIGIEVKALQAVQLFRDWQRSRADDQKYPQIPIAILPVKTWTLEGTRDYFVRRITILEENWDKPDNELPLCTPEETWTSETTYAVMTEGRKSAHRVLSSMALALEWVEENGDKLKKPSIVTRLGSARRCEEYCGVAPHCSQFQATKETK